MTRGFRWQLLAMVIAAGVFALSLLLRPSDTGQDIEATLAGPTLSPTNTPIPSNPTPIPVDNPQQAADTSGQSRVSNEIATYREALIGSVQRLNPVFVGLNPVDRDIASLIFEGLTRIDAYGEPVPSLAKSWVISADGLEYVLRLRDDVLWQDGMPFTADDVTYTMAILLAPDFPGQAELGAFWRTVETYKLDDHTVRFRLTHPLAGFLYHLAWGILPAHALEGTGAAQLALHPFNLHPIGTGPYQLETLGSEDGQTISEVTLRVAPVFRQRPEGKNGYALDRVSFRLYASFDAALQALQAGEVDGLAARSFSERPALLNISTASDYTSIAPALGVLIFNWDENGGNRHFREQRVRQALEIGLSRESIIERDMSNQAVVADGPLLPGSWAFDGSLTWPQTDPDQARRLLDSITLEPAGTATPEGETTETVETPLPEGILFEFSILTPDIPALVSVAQEIASQWSQYGLLISVETADSAAHLQRLDVGDFDAAIVELAMSADPDVYAYWHQGQYPDGMNYGNVNDSRVSQLLERARRDANGINRAQLYSEFQRDFVDRAIALPLYYPLFTYAVSLRIAGVQLGFIGAPEDRFRNISQWMIARP